MNGKSLITAIIAVITLSLALVGTIIGGVIYIGDLKERIGALEKQTSRPDPFTGKDAIFFATDLQKANPKMIVPLPVHHSDGK